MEDTEKRNKKKSQKMWSSLTGIEPDVGVEPTTLRWSLDLRVSRSTD